MNKRKSKGSNNLLIIAILIILMIQIISNPSLSINSAKLGLELWFNLLLPSLLPFIFISNLLISLGFVSMIGKLLEPIMKPVFNVSGAGIFPFSMSIMSGYPIGAKLTSNLRENNLISQTEGNRLISFSSVSGPLFILGAVLIGMLNEPGLSMLMIAPHYLGAITMGFIFRFYKRSNKNMNINIKKQENQVKKEKSIGSLITKCIKDSMDSIFVIGGFVIIYSVVINLLLQSQLFNLLINRVSNYTSMDADLLKGIVAGIIELTNGAKIISSLNIDLIIKIIALNFLISWGGFSIHSQALSFISSTDLSSKIYLISKFFHGLLSALYTYILYILKYKDIISTTFNKSPIMLDKPSVDGWFYLLASSTEIVLSLVVFLFLLSILIDRLKVEKNN